MRTLPYTIVSKHGPNLRDRSLAAVFMYRRRQTIRVEIITRVRDAFSLNTPDREVRLSGLISASVLQVIEIAFHSTPNFGLG